MYQPPHFRIEDRAILLDIIRRHPLAQLVTAGPGGLMANPIPFVAAETDGQLLLRAHLARPNGQWRELAAGAEALVIFQSHEAYVSPSWYASKREHGKVVPTWNYVTVQARGPATVDESPAWLRGQLDEITSQQESPRAEPWAVADAPEPFVEGQMRGIVGIEIAVAEIVGKFKLSQNRSDADREGVRAGLAATGREADAALGSLVPPAGQRVPS